MESKVLQPIELPPENGQFSFFLNYNGEPAFAISIENMPENLEGEDWNAKRTEMVSAKLTVVTMPIEGGEGEKAEVTLYMRGKEL